MDDMRHIFLDDVAVPIQQQLHEIAKRRAEERVARVFKYSLPVSSELDRDPAQRMKHHMDLLNLIRAPNLTKVKIRSRPRAAHEVHLLTMTANCVIEMEDPAAATDSSGVPSTIERSQLDFADEAEASNQGAAAPEVGQAEEDVPATSVPEVGVSRRGSTRRGKSFTAIELGMASTLPAPVPKSAPVSDPNPLSFADPPSRHPADIAQSSPGTAVARDPDSENASSLVEVRSPENHAAPPGYFFELRHLHNDEVLRQYNVNLTRQVAMGSQLRLRFEQEAKLLRKSVAQVAHRDKRIKARELEIKNLETLLETEADMKKAAEDRSAGLIQELEDMRARFSDLQVSNELLSQQVATLQEQVSGEEKLKAAFEEFKRYEDDRVEQRCAKLDARLDALRIDFDEKLYPHMLIAIAGCRQAFADFVSVGIAKGMSEGLRHGALKDLKYPLVDQLEGLKDAPMDAIMAALYLESDTGDDASQYIRDLRPSSSQLTVPVYPEGLALLLADAATQTEFENT
nr:hypothetical protein [Tanacetum cinerariifolium]